MTDEEVYQAAQRLCERIITTIGAAEPTTGIVVATALALLLGSTIHECVPLEKREQAFDAMIGMVRNVALEV